MPTGTGRSLNSTASGKVRCPARLAPTEVLPQRVTLPLRKERGIKDTVFARKRGLAVLEMAKSNWVYKKLRNFRAGIEAGISVIKRAFGPRPLHMVRLGGIQALRFKQHLLLQPPGHDEDQAGIGLIGEIRSGTLSRLGITVARILEKGMKYREPGCDRQRLRIYRKVTLTTGADAVLKQGFPDGH